MLESPGYRLLNLTARRILDRVEVELARHAGYDNHNLPITYDQLIAYGARRNKIITAIKTLKALGYITIQYGRGGNADYRRPSKFGLTYRYTRVRFGDAIPATDDWQRIKTTEEALEIVRQIASSDIDHRYDIRRGKIETSLGTETETSLGNETETDKSPVSEPRLRGESRNRDSFLDSRGGGRGRGGGFPQEGTKLPWHTPVIEEVIPLAYAWAVDDRVLPGDGETPPWDMGLTASSSRWRQ
jgi:hypothetical protein